LFYLCFSKNDGACYGQDTDKNRMARYVDRAFCDDDEDDDNNNNNTKIDNAHIVRQ